MTKNNKSDVLDPKDLGTAKREKASTKDKKPSVITTITRKLFAIGSGFLLCAFAVVGIMNLVDGNRNVITGLAVVAVFGLVYVNVDNR